MYGRRGKMGKNMQLLHEHEFQLSDSEVEEGRGRAKIPTGKSRF